MASALYEVAAITPYTDSYGSEESEAGELQAAYLRSWPPVKALFTTESLGWHQSDPYSGSDGSTDSACMLTTLHQDPSVDVDSHSSMASNSRSVLESSNQGESQILKETDTNYCSKVESLETLRHQAQKTAWETWGFKMDSSFDKEKGNGGVKFVKQMSSSNPISESVGSWTEASVSQRELSASSWWGENIISTSISQGSSIEDVPLLASTMLESEHEYSTQSEIMDAVRKVNRNNALHFLDATGVVAPNTEKSESFIENDLQNINFIENSRATLDPPCLVLENKNEVKVNKDTANNHFAKIASNFLETNRTEKLHPQLEESLKSVANQLCELQNSKAPALNQDPPKPKSYRDVLLGAPATVSRYTTWDSSQLSDYAADSKFKTNGQMSSLINSKEYSSAHSTTKEQGSKMDNKSDDAVQSRANSAMYQSQTQTVKQKRPIEEQRKQVSNEWQQSSFYSSNNSASSFLTASDSTSELYDTALSRLQDTDQNSSFRSDVDKNHADSYTDVDGNTLDGEKLYQVSDDEKGNLADVECSCEVDLTVDDISLSDNECGRGRTRRREMHNQVLRSDLYLKTSCKDQESTSTGSDISTSKLRAELMQLVSKGGRLNTTSSGLSLSDDCPSLRSSSIETCKSSDPRASHSSSRSSSLSTSSSSPGVEPTTKLNPECPPFVPRSARLIDSEELSNTTLSGFLATGTQRISGELRHPCSDVWKKQTDYVKSLDESLMPPPLTTKVPGLGGSQLKRLQQLQLSTADSGIGSAIDTTGHCNTSTNTTQGGRHTSAARPFDDSNNHHADTTDTAGNDVFLSPDVSRQKDENGYSGLKNSTIEHSSYSTCPSYTENHLQHLYDDRLGDFVHGFHGENNTENNQYVSSNRNQTHSVRLSPYMCTLQHQSDFVPVCDISQQSGPRTSQKGDPPRDELTPANEDALLSISQRVVRLRVKKPMLPQHPTSPSNPMPGPVQQNEPRPEYDHYGTGFVYLVDSDCFCVRTHKAVIGSVEDAAKSEISFELFNPETRQTLLLHCGSDKDPDLDRDYIRFSSHTHSQVTTFRCATPRELVPWLHLFEPIPVTIRESLFEDSCYFSDCSLENSMLDVTNSEVYNKDVRCSSASSNDRIPQAFKSVISRKNQREQNSSCDPLQAESIENSDYRKDLADDVFLKNSESKQNVSFQVSNCFDQGEQYGSSNLTWDMTGKQTGAMAEERTDWSGEFSVRDQVGERFNVWQKPCGNDGRSTDPEAKGFSPFRFISLGDSLIDVTSPHEDVDNESKHADHVQQQVLQMSSLDDVPKACEINIAERSVDAASKISNLCQNVHFDSNVVNNSDGYVDSPRGASSQDAQPGAVVNADPTSRCQYQLAGTSVGSAHTPGRHTGRGVGRLRRVGEDRRPSSPLVIMERRAAAESRATLSGVGQCPYGGTNLFGKSGLYTCFSSYAGDVVDSMREHLTNFGSRREESPGRGEYLRLLYAQNNHRASYDRQRRLDVATSVLEEGEMTSGEKDSDDSVFLRDEREHETAQASAASKPSRSAVLEDGESGPGREKVKAKAGCGTKPHEARDFRLRTHRLECDSMVAKRRYAPVDPFKDLDTRERYMSTWNINLLNLNPDLTPLPDFRTVASTLSYVLDEGDPSCKSCCLPATPCAVHNKGATTSTSRPRSRSDSLGTDTRAIIISHPHGGSKMVSTGFFSRHYHVGGNLYDTPTCMGSCGAPVISLARDGSGLQVTHLVHSGIVSVNGIATGMGVVSFQI